MKITTNIKYDAKTQKFMNQGVFGAINSEVGTKGIIELKSLTNSLSKKSTGKLAGYWDLTIGKDIIAWINNANYAGYWYNGRGPVRPVRKKSLHWDDVFSKYSRATKGVKSKLDSIFTNKIMESVRSAIDKA